MVKDFVSLISDLVGIANDAALLVDESGEIVFANAGATHLTGYEIQELIGASYEMLVPKESLPSHKGLFKNHMESGPSKHLMGARRGIDLITKDGERRQVGISLAKQTSLGQKYVGVVLTDYTEMEIALSKLRANDLLLTQTITQLERAQRRFTFAQALSGVGSWDWDIASGELFWSDEVYTIFGLKPGDIQPTYEAFLEFIHPEDRAQVETAVQNTLDDPTERYDIIHRIVLPSGEVRIVREMGLVEVDEGSKPVLMVGSVQDITEAQQLKQKTENALMREIEASRTKTEFLANLSHELRTPLNAVIGFSTLLKDTQLDNLDAQSVAEYATYIHEAGTHLHHLVDDILEVSRIDLGIVELKEADVDLGKVVQTVQAILNSRALEKGIAIIYDFDLDLPFRLDGDELRIKQMLLNLMGNSAKFCPHGSVITVRVRLREDNGIQIEVADNGPGMEQEQVETILGRFNRAESALTRTFEGGLGLGLTLTKAYLSLHDATMAIETAPGEGMKVQLNFPPERTINL